MTWYQIATIAGVPSLAAAFIAWLVRWSIKQLKAIREEDKSVKSGVQALLRSQMIDDYNHYLKKGYAPIYAKDSFDNCWRQYHNLGANGVMNDLHDKFMALPTAKEADNER